jgi:PAS domain S-box-containing protein
MEREDDRVLAERIAEGIRRSGRARTILIVGTALGLLLAVVGGAIVRSLGVRAYAEDALRQQRLLLESVFGSIRDGVIAADQNGRFLLVNSAARQMVGIGDTEVDPSRWSEHYGVFQPDTITPFPVEDLPMTRALRGESTDDVPMLIRHARLPHELWVNVSSRPLRDPEGNVRGGVSIINDMTSRRATENELRQSEERFRSLVESIKDDAMFLLDEDGRVASWNAGAERICGYAAQEIVGQHVSRLYAVNDIELGKPQEELAIAARTGRFEGEGWRVRKNGPPYWAGVILTSMHNPAGAIRGYTMVSRDLNEGRKSESRYRSLLEATPDAIIIVNQDGRIELANAQMEAVFGYTRPELIGASVDVLLPERFRGTHDGYRHRFFHSPERRAMGEGRDLFGMRKDGTEFPVEVSLSPLETEDGVLALAAIRDGTERRRAETKFRALLESAPDAMVIVDEQGRIELANAQTESLFGHTRPELLGKSVDILVPERLRGAPGEHRHGFFQSPKRRAMGEGRELFGLRKDGTEFPMEISLSPLEDPSGSSLMAAIRDISQREKAKQHLIQTIAELKRSNDELEQFAYVTSHDLQEPLRMVASYTQLLAKHYKGRLGTDADEFIMFAVDGATRMRRLIQDLLAYSRAGTSDEPLSAIASEDALREALANLEGAVKDGAAIVTHDPLPTVTMNRPQLAQIFQNLIGNAIKYRGADSPRIHVTARSVSGQGHVFSVQDNGLGIDPQQFERIFVIFQRLHARNAFTGTGIGLAICKKLVERHGGRIWVDSEPGRGSTFHFSLLNGATA